MSGCCRERGGAREMARDDSTERERTRAPQTTPETTHKTTPQTTHEATCKGETRDGAPADARFASLLGEAVEAADRSGMAHFVTRRVSLSDCDPLAHYERAAGDDRFYWCQPAAGLALSTRGAVAVVEAKGESRFEDAWRGVREIASRLHTGHGAGEAAQPVFVGGFAFEAEPGSGTAWQAYPPARLVLPEALVRRDRHGSFALLTQRLAPGGSLGDARLHAETMLRDVRREAGAVWHRTPDVHPDPPRSADGWEEGAEYAVIADRPHDVYRGQVAAALRAIDEGELEKVVLARALDVRHPGRFDLEAFLATLARIYPHCTVFAVGSGDDTLVAASPELLLRHDGETIATCALAGSAPRGRSPEEDDALGRALAESPKEQAEHRAVVSAVRASLAGRCEALSVPERPELRRFEGIQHLATAIEGRLRSGHAASSLLELAARLHPTPAVGGLPELPARKWITHNEGLDRGWYAGPVGWVDTAGRGELWVALRSALVRNAATGDPQPASHARLFAGAGIVAGSEPDQELRETRLKLRALLAPLTEI